MNKLVICLFGLVDSGKTTVGRKLNELLPHSTFLDAHQFRDFCGNGDYSEEGREKNIRNLCSLLDALEGNGIFILSFSLPTNDLRQILKDRHNAKMVLCDAELETCKLRDKKGLYSRSANDESVKLPLISMDYDTLGKDLTVRTGDFPDVTTEANVTHAAEKIIRKLVSPNFPITQI